MPDELNMFLRLEDALITRIIRLGLMNCFGKSETREAGKFI